MKVIQARECRNRRRRFLLALGTAITGSPTLLPAQTPAARQHRIAVVASGTRAGAERTLKPFFDEMRQLGWVEGQNVTYEHAQPGDRPQDLPRLVAELVERKPDLLYTLSAPAALAAKQASGTIPIVFAGGMDPVAAGLVASLARPGGNATGVTTVAGSIGHKRIELLHDMLPGAKRIGLLGDPTYPSFAAGQAVLAPLVATLGLTLVVAEASNPADFEAALGKLVAQRVDAIVAHSVLAFSLRGRLMELAQRARVPVVVEFVEMTEAGALFSYSASLADQLRRSAHLADKVLKGAKPADIAVEQPTRFELVINLKTAKALGITIPQSVLLRADKVIE
jgi:putative tryptophan/tyrosine transport system substrate-binding protein